MNNTEMLSSSDLLDNLSTYLENKKNWKVLFLVEQIKYKILQEAFNEVVRNK